MGGCGVWPVSAMSRAKRIVGTAMVAAAIGLLVTGLLKVLDIVMGTVKPRANGVFPFIDDDVLFPLTGLLEVVVGVYVLLSRCAHPVRSLASLAWIGSLFLLYRVGLAVYGEGACGCGGLFWASLHIREGMMAAVFQGFLGFLLVVGYGGLIIIYHGCRRAEHV